MSAAVSDENYTGSHAVVAERPTIEQSTAAASGGNSVTVNDSQSVADGDTQQRQPPPQAQQNEQLGRQNGQSDMQPTPSPRRRMPSGLSASISPSSVGGSLGGGVQLLQAPVQRSEPGRQTDGPLLLSGTAAADASPTCIGGGNGRMSVGNASGQHTGRGARANGAQVMSNTIRQAGVYPAEAHGTLPVGAPAPAMHGLPPQLVAGIVPDLAHLAVPYRGHMGTAPTFMHSQAAPFGRVPNNLALRNPSRGGQPPGSTQPRAALQVLGERLDSVPDPRALDVIMSARHGMKRLAAASWGSSASVSSGRKLSFFGLFLDHWLAGNNR